MLYFLTPSGKAGSAWMYRVVRWGENENSKGKEDREGSQQALAVGETSGKFPSPS